MKKVGLLHSLRSVGGYGRRIFDFLRLHKRGLMLSAGGSAIVSSIVLFGCDAIPHYSMSFQYVKPPTLSSFQVVSPTIKYGFALDTFSVTEAKTDAKDVFQRILREDLNLSSAVSDSLTQAAKKYYDFDRLQNDCTYAILSRNVAEGADYFIFEPDPKRYIVFDLKRFSVKEVMRTVEVLERAVCGTVKNSLWETMVKNGMTYQLADKVEDALKYKFDLRKFEDGDVYKLIYDEEICEGRSIGIRKLKAVCIQEKSVHKPVYAFYYEGEHEKGYFSKDGLSMKEGFLKSPLKFSRITSRYNLKRFHPILRYRRPHFGTDYAAPHGTPILSVADGVVVEARYSSGNGNYVKIQHQKPYETQYLHMSRFAKGMKRGTKVSQGQIIGYVGSTGLATGPHVCFRFWKHGHQVDHLREKLPQFSAFHAADVVKFRLLSDSLSWKLEKISPNDAVLPKP